MRTLPVTKELSGWHLLAMFVGFFGIVIVVNIFMAVMAVRSWTGLVVENSYVASQSFNADTAGLKKSESLGFSHHLHYEKGKLTLSLLGADGKPMMTENVQISIGRPVDDGEDQKLTALHLGEGQFVADAKLSAGVWSGELSALVQGNQVWRQPFKLIVSGN